VVQVPFSKPQELCEYELPTIAIQHVAIDNDPIIISACTVSLCMRTGGHRDPDFGGRLTPRCANGVKCQGCIGAVPSLPVKEELMIQLTDMEADVIRSDPSAEFPSAPRFCSLCTWFFVQLGCIYRCTEPSSTSTLIPCPIGHLFGQNNEYRQDLRFSLPGAHPELGVPSFNLLRLGCRDRGNGIYILDQTSLLQNPSRSCTESVLCSPGF